MRYVNALLVITGWIALVITVAVICKNRWNKQRELSRKVVHIGIGPLIPLAWWLNIPTLLAIPFASLVTIFLLINYRWRLIPIFEDIKRDSYGTIAYGLSITLMLTLFWSHNPAAVCAGVLVMAFGDGLAGLIGRNVTSPSWLIFGQRKSTAGTLTMVITGLLALITLNLTIGSPLNPIQLFTISCLATSLEQISLLGIDNLTVPIGTAFTWWFMTTT